MLKLFFHRHSWIARASELVGLALWTALLLRGAAQGWSTAEFSVVLCFLSGYGAVRWCALRRWHPSPSAQRLWQSDLGLESHFRKVAIPARYLLAGSAFWIVGHGAAAWLLPATALFAAIIYVNVTLLVLRHRDHSETPINCFSARAPAPAHASTSAEFADLLRPHERAANA